MDAAAVVIGPILRQERVIAYDSALLNQRQHNYSVRNKELFPLVRALRAARMATLRRSLKGHRVDIPHEPDDVGVHRVPRHVRRASRAMVAFSCVV